MGIYRDVVIKGYMIEVPVSKDVKNANYGIYDTFVCSYSRYKLLKAAIADRPEEARSEIKANKCVPHNTVYYVNEVGAVTKYLIIDEDISGE